LFTLIRVNHKYDFVMTHYELLTVVASYLAQPTPVLRQGTKMFRLI